MVERCNRTVALKGIEQRTAQSGRVRSGAIEVLFERKGLDQGGDGTVPRISSHPVEWAQEDAVMVAQTHAMLQSTEFLHVQILGILSGHVLGAPQSAGVRLRLTVPEVVIAGRRFRVEATTHDGSANLALLLTVAERGQKHEFGMLKAVGGGRYTAEIDGLTDGAWLVQISSPVVSVTSVADWIIAWGQD